MIHHAGLLDDEPTQSPLYQWVRTSQLSHMPDEIATPLRVWFLTPGFTTLYHSRAFAIGERTAMRHVEDALSHREELMPLVSANWLSVERPDVVKLSQYRENNQQIPLLVKMQIGRDLQSGMKQVDIQKLYRVNALTVYKISRFGPFVDTTLPDWFTKELI